MTIKQLLTELFDRSVPYSPFVQDENKIVSWFYIKDMIYTFVATDQDPYDITFIMIRPQFNAQEKAIVNKNPYAKEVWDVIRDEVRVVGTTKMTGTGHAAEVIGTIVKIFDRFIDKYHPMEITFGAKTSERGRVKLYKRLARLAAEKYTYHNKEKILGNFADWRLTKKDQQ